MSRIAAKIYPPSDIYFFSKITVNEQGRNGPGAFNKKDLAVFTNIS